MRLFGVNQVRTRGARVTAFSSPEVLEGDPVDVEATFANTGNVAYAPRAVVEARPVERAGTGDVVVSKTMDAEDTDPGAEGRLSASITLPEGATGYTLTVRLLDEGRELDARTVSVTPVEKPPLLDRLGGFLTENALAIIGALMILLLGGAFLAGRYVRRLRIAARGDNPAPASDV